MFNRIPYSEEGWSVIIKSISDAAKHEGIPQWRLEVIFKVGDGTGRVWRSWRNKRRVARQFTRERIITEAYQRGWLNLSKPQQRELENIPDEVIYALPNASHCCVSEVPDPPIQCAIANSARLAASALMDDAYRHDGKLCNLREWATTCEYPFADGKEWRVTVKQIRDEIEDIERHETPEFAEQSKRALYVQLVLLYRKRGYK